MEYTTQPCNSVEDGAKLRGNLSLVLDGVVKPAWTQRVILDFSTTAHGRRDAIAVLLSPDDAPHVTATWGKDTERLRSAIAPFLMAARDAADRRNAGRPPRGPVLTQRVVIDLDITSGPGLTVSVALGPDEAPHVFSLPQRYTPRLQEVIDPFLASARQEADRRNAANGRDTPKTRRDRVRPPAIRAWAMANGYQLRKRGRIPNEIVAAYESAVAGRQDLEVQPGNGY